MRTTEAKVLLKTLGGRGECSEHFMRRSGCRWGEDIHMKGRVDGDESRHAMRREIKKGWWLHPNAQALLDNVNSTLRIGDFIKVSRRILCTTNKNGLGNDIQRHCAKLGTNQGFVSTI